MRLDIEDVIGGAVGSLVGRIVLFISAVWIGCGIGAGAMLSAEMVRSGTLNLQDTGWIIASPLMIFSYWGLLNVPFLLFALVHFVRDEDEAYLPWAIVAGVESLAVMAGWAHYFTKGWLGISLAWIIWALLLAMVEAGVWFIYQFFRNRWAQEIAILQAENHYRIAEQETIERLRIEREKQHDH